MAARRRARARRPLPRGRDRARRRRALRRRDHATSRAVMEHVEEAGIHSGDSSCVLPAPSDCEPRSATLVRALGPALGVVGLLNVQLAIARRRALRARGQPARLAHRARSPRRRPASTWSTPPAGSPPGATLAELELPPEGVAPCPATTSRRRCCPFVRFPGADPVLGPEMRSTGEVMASGADFATAFAQGRARGGPRAATRAAARS